MLGLDPKKPQIVADVRSILDRPGYEIVTIYETTASDAQIRGQLLSHVAGMITPQMLDLDSMVCSLLRSCSRLAKEAVFQWSDTPVPERAEDETYEDWLHRRYVSLDATLEHAGLLMSSAVEMSRAGGTYSAFRRAFVEPGDSTIVAVAAGAISGICSLDRAGLKVEDRAGASLTALRDHVARTTGHRLPDIYAVSILRHGNLPTSEKTVSASHITQAISLSLPPSRGDLASIHVRVLSDGRVTTIEDRLDTLLERIAVFEATGEAGQDANLEDFAEMLDPEPLMSAR